MGSADAEMIEERGSVGRHLLRRVVERIVALVGRAVTSIVERDHPVADLADRAHPAGGNPVDGMSRGEAVDQQHGIGAIGRRLSRRRSVYAAVFAALAGLADAPIAAGEAGEAGEDEADTEDLAALDRAWEDEAVTFGPGAAAAGCPKAEAMLERMKSPRDQATEGGAEWPTI